MTRYLTTKPMESGKSKANTLIWDSGLSGFVRRRRFSKTEQMHDLVIGLSSAKFGLSSRTDPQRNIFKSVRLKRANHTNH